jgi:UDP:flavonoid glycosyltransferase YjiC (YdhE family)
MTSSDFLLATWDGGGHAAPMLSIARALLARGHRVRVLADPILRSEVEASGALFVPWRDAPHRSSATERITDVIGDWEARSPAQAGALLRDRLVTGPSRQFADDTRRELHRRPADVVAADHLLPGALVAGAAEGARTVAIATTVLGIPQWGVPAAGVGARPASGLVGRARNALLARLFTRAWARGLPDYNAARAAHGLAPIDDPVALVGDWDRVLVLTSAALEFPEWAPPAHVRIVGPRLDDPAWAAPWHPPTDDRPLVLVSLSSTYMNQADLLGRVADGLGRLDVHGLVTTGPSIDPDAFAAPPNVRIVRSAAHTKVLRHAAAVVTHAGHGTVAKALAAGVPLLAVPLGRDQPDVAARIVAAVAGLRLPAKSTAEQIAGGVGRLLADSAYRAGAARVAETIASERRQDLAVAELEALAAESALGAVRQAA